MVGMQARLTNYTFLPPPPPGLQATPLHIRVHCCLWIIIFPHKMQIFESNQNSRFRPQNETTGEHCKFNVLFFKSINLKVPNLTAPLKRSGRFFWSWNNFDWIRFLDQFCIKICHFIQFVWCEKATDQILGLYSLTSKTSYRKISWSIEAVSFGFRLFQSPQQQCCWDCQISERSNYNIQSRVFETSRDFAVRGLTA